MYETVRTSSGRRAARWLSSGRPAVSTRTAVYNTNATVETDVGSY